jgi:uncharacterized protein (TIRG00374 family)
MAGSTSKPQKKKGIKHWALFAVRWGVAAVGVWLVLKNISLHDQALVILDTKTNRPQLVTLKNTVAESEAVFPVVDPTNPNRVIPVPRANVVNAPDVKTVQRLIGNDPRGGTRKVQLLGVDLEGDLDKSPVTRKLLVADDATSKAEWITPDQVPGYGEAAHVPYPRDEIGMESLVKRAQAMYLWAALLVFPLTFLITSYRWHELLKALDIHIGQYRAFVLNMVGCFYNTFLPGSTGGDAFKAYYISKHTPHRTRAVMSVLVDRAVGLLALIIVGGFTASFQWHIKECRRVSIAAVGICICVAIGMLLFYNKTLHRLSGMDFLLKKLPMQKQVRGAVDAMHRYGERPVLAIWALIISLPVHGAVISSAMLAGMAFGLQIHWAYYWVAVPVIVLAGAMPGPPQGAGVMELFAVLLLRPQGVTVSQAFALTMSIRMVQILWNLAGGLFVLRGGFHAPTEGEQKELKELPPEDNDGDTPPALVPA